ncbi:mycothiol transferase [Georgenia sunbinii]|uniref:mycothiol transferase n=1 Tax=Georgenia sunbinii TaxID=3117728 RepID=UPI002F2682A7
MSVATELLLDAFSRVQGSVHRAVDGLGVDDVAVQLDPEANSVGWLLWHLTRVQDDHVSDVAGDEQRWTAAGWDERFGLPLPSTDTGYGHGPDDVAAVSGVPPADLVAYYDAVHERTLAFVRGLTDEDLDRVVDEGWDPPVTLGVRLVSVVDDCLEHAGQANFVAGVLRRRQT